MQPERLRGHHVYVFATLCIPSHAQETDITLYVGSFKSGGTTTAKMSRRRLVCERGGDKGGGGGEGGVFTTWPNFDKMVDNAYQLYYVFIQTCFFSQSGLGLGLVFKGQYVSTVSSKLQR